MNYVQQGSFRDGSLGHPLYVNGHRYDEPVTISHVPGPVAGLGMDDDVSRGLAGMYSVIAVLGAAMGVYHGYKRNSSVGWAVVWGIAGSIVPIVTIPLSLAQGYGERK